MIQAILSLLLLGGTGGYLLSQSLISVSGPALFVVAIVAVSFAIALYSHSRSLGQQG